ncbi:MAG TPA: hypothetical protein P5084_03855 [Paludibacter sp.]|nr:hypothetical protein [Paludibacter sp.]
MKNKKQLGICMDHSSALIMELINNLIISTESEYESMTKIENEANNENGRDDHQAQTNYYKKISDIIRNYDEVLLFGPAEAKNVLYNLIKEDHNFENIKIEIRTTDKMTENQIFAFVKDYFNEA